MTITEDELDTRDADTGFVRATNLDGIELWMGPSGHITVGGPTIPQPGWRRVFIEISVDDGE
jgi:hypothetical protein